MKIRMYISIACVALFALSMNVAQATVILSFETSKNPIKVGEQVNIDLVISGLVDDPATLLTNEDALGAFDLRMGYNPFLLEFNGIVFGNQLDILGLGSISFFEKDPPPAFGVVDLFEISLDSILDLESLQLDSFTLATFTFTGLSYGTSQLYLARPDLSDARGNSITARVDVGSMTVPEPATVALLALGLVGVALSRRRGKY